MKMKFYLALKEQNSRKRYNGGVVSKL